MLYALLLPVLLWYIVFCYLPMGGITLAFRNYRYDMGLWHSPWVGFQHFRTMFQDSEFWRAFANTLIFSFGKLLFHFPVPIIVAILLNEIRHPKVKKFFQTVFTFLTSSLGWFCPAFLSICLHPTVSSIRCSVSWDLNKSLR